MAHVHSLLPGSMLLLLGAMDTVQAATQGEDFLSLSLNELMQAKVVTASNIEQNLLDAPAAMLVITREDIVNRGYTYIGDVFRDLPGFDFVFYDSASDNILYQRGYRTTSTRRTLFMVNGTVENEMWSHNARTSHQYPIEHIERIEVLYGPSSAVYGPNAFLGIVNIITKKAEHLTDGEHSAQVTGELGSYDSQRLEISAVGRLNDFSYSIGAKFYDTDGADFAADWPFLDDERYSNATIWGPIRDFKINGENLDKYYSPSKYHGLIANLHYKKLELGIIDWKTDGGYGTYYTGDWAQSNASWQTRSSKIYLNYHFSVTDKLASKTLLLYREDRTWGDWAEAFPDWAPGQGDYSYISLTNWNVDNNSHLFKQDFEYQLSANTMLLAGVKYQEKDLTRAYDVPGYFGAYSSTVPADDPGPYGLGAAVGYSTDDSYIPVAKPRSQVPSDNRVDTDDKGIYIEAVHSYQHWRFNAGIRYDENNIYGSSTNPRLSAIYKLGDDQGAIKLIYGEAFQEPAPSQLFGGWNGAFANPDLKPETAQNLELVFMYGAGNWLHDVSIYQAKYKDVIQESAENAGDRDTKGLEYRGRFTVANFLSAPEIEGYFYYTYTKAMSDIAYDHQAGVWIDRDTEVGDIAPHKLHLGVNVPVNQLWNVNLRSRFMSSRKLYSRNPLREQGDELSSFTVFDAGIHLNLDRHQFGVTVKNLFDKAYYHPGAEQADSGNDFSQRSQGYRNSLIPQPGRSYWFKYQYQFSGL